MGCGEVSLERSCEGKLQNPISDAGVGDDEPRNKIPKEGIDDLYKQYLFPSHFFKASCR